MEQTFFVAGGDARQEAIIHQLKEAGRSVSALGFQAADHLTPEIAAHLGAADIILLPLPAADSDNCLNAPSMEKRLPMEMLWSLLHPQQKIFGGMLSEALLRSAAEYNLLPIDYYKREEFVLRNAYITAEGALELTMDRLKRTVKGTNCLILGYGRIGKFLARLLLNLHARVTVAARKGKDLVQAELDGCIPCPLRDLAGCLPRCDVLYNTIPHLILDQTLLPLVPKSCLCIDLASKPGGIDLRAAEQLELETIWALGLPGKVAPGSAGQAIVDTVLQILTEQEVSL